MLRLIQPKDDLSSCLTADERAAFRVRDAVGRGLIVTCPPDIYFYKDTDGDGKADVKRTLLTGFDFAKSTPLRVNCPTLGPDGWIHFAAGLVGGTITSPEHPEKPAVKVTGDLGWNPRTGDFETVDGKSQYGIASDDFGRRNI